MAPFHNPPPVAGQVSINRRDSLCDVLQYVSAQSLDFLDLVQKISFLDRKFPCTQNPIVDGHQLEVHTFGLFLRTCAGGALLDGSADRLRRPEKICIEIVKTRVLEMPHQLHAKPSFQTTLVQ